MITISSILFQDEYTGTLLSPIYAHDDGTPVFMGSVGDRMIAKITGFVSWGSSDIPVVSVSADKTITRTDAGSFLFDEFIAGDTILISGTTTIDGTFTIASVTDTIITVNESISSGTFANAYIAGITKMNSFNVWYSLQPDTSIESLTDTSYQKLMSDVNVIDLEDPSNTAYLFPNGSSYAWYDDDISNMSGSNNLTGIQSFTIYLHFYIKPFYLAGQIQNLQSLLNGESQPPFYFAGDNTLNFNLKIDAKRKSTHPPRFTNLISVPGNIGWFNEFLNGQQSLNIDYSSPSCGNPVDWKFESITYTDHLTGDVVDSLDYNRDTDVELILSVTEDEAISYFTTSAWENAPFVLNFLWATQSAGNYQNKNCIIVEPSGPLPIGTGGNNFVNYRSLLFHDRCFTTVGAAAANGDRYGSRLQVIKNVQSSIISYGALGNKCTITFTTSLGSNVKSAVSGADNNYILWVTPQSAYNAPNSEGVTTLEGTDRNAVLCDVNQFANRPQNPTLLTGILKFTKDNMLIATDIFDGVQGDYGLAFMDFTVPAGAIIENVTLRFDVAITDSITNEIVSTFNLQNWDKSTSSFFNGTFTDINIIDFNNFTLDPNSIYQFRQLIRNPAGDIYSGTTITRYAYKILYGFQIGYQWWIPLATVDSRFRSFATQYWPVYTEGTLPGIPAVRPPGFNSYIGCSVNFSITENGENFIFNAAGLIRAWDKLRYNDITESINTYDLVGNNLQGEVLNGQQTEVEITFSSDNFIIPSGSTPIGNLTFQYNSPDGNIFDTVSTSDTDKETPTSLWTAPITITKSTYGSTDVFTITGILDTSLLDFPLTTGYIIYGNLTFQQLSPNYVNAAEDLVLDTADNVSNINLVDSGQDVVIGNGGLNLINFIDAGQNVVL